MTMAMLEQVPPHNIEVEKAALGAALLDHEAGLAMSARLTPDVFYVRDHQIIWLAITHLLHEGQPVDLVTVHDWLRQNHPEERPWHSLLTECLAICPTAANWWSYAKMLRRDWIRRAILVAAGDVIERAYTLRDPEAILEPILKPAHEFLRSYDEAETW